MRDKNLIILSGHVINPPEGRKDAVTFKMVWINPRKDGPDDRCEAEVIAFGPLGSKCATLRPGAFVEVEGSMHSWVEALAGKKKQFWQIKAREVHIPELRSPSPKASTGTNDDWNIGL